MVCRYSHSRLVSVGAQPLTPVAAVLALAQYLSAQVPPFGVQPPRLKARVRFPALGHYRMYLAPRLMAHVDEPGHLGQVPKPVYLLLRLLPLTTAVGGDPVLTHRTSIRLACIVPGQ